jgi:amino acid transporter
MSLMTVSMIIVVATFGLENVIDNLAAMGLASIPSWVAVGFLYFLPLALILAEFASDSRDQGGGIYSFMERGLGPFWAFVGTWSYLVSNLVYLQSRFSRLPIRISLAVSGKDVFDAITWVLPLLGVAACVMVTLASTRGVRVFARLADWVGKGTLILLVGLIVVPIVLVAAGRPSANAFTLEALTPSLDLGYFSTFAWLLFAVSGAEVAAPYVRQVDNPERNFPRAILLTTVLIGGAYVLATISMALLVPLSSLTKATGMYDVFLSWSHLLGASGPLVARACMTFVVIGTVAAYVIWMESPIRAMFAELPVGTFPERLTQRDGDGTHHAALWIQAGVVSSLILIPLLSILTGSSGSERFISLLNDLSSLSLIVPFVFVALAYIQARRKGMDAPFKMVRSNRLAIAIGCLVLVISAFGYLGAGLFALEAEIIDWTYVGIVYAGPALVVLLGILLRAISLRIYRARLDRLAERPL